MITYLNKEIIFADFSGLKEQQDLIDVALTASRNIRACEYSPVLFLCDFTNAVVGTEVMTSIKDEGKYILKNIPIITAITGISGLKQVLIQGYIRFTGSKLRIFDTLQEAKDDLIIRSQGE